ncbi:MAG: glycosyltransferase [bacterium]|nr:glycosyltransferase [bacterium]MDA1292886.1 glycosyltransferase [bacterium]
MRVCILQPVLDPFKGANHLSLYEALPHIEFTIVCNRSKAEGSMLPKNVHVVTVPGRIGSYYYGIADFFFARRIIKKYPVHSDFWSQFTVIHINQTMGPALQKLKATGVPLLFLIHHPVTADKEVSGWVFKYALLIRFQRALCKSADRIVTVSETVKQRIAHDYHVPPENISVVYNGVDGSVFKEEAFRNNYDVIAMGSFIHPRKGFPYLITVYQAFSDAGLHIADIGRRSD